MNTYFYIERTKTELIAGTLRDNQFMYYYLALESTGNQPELFHFVGDLLSDLEEGRSLISFGSMAWICRYLTENIPEPLDGILLTLNHIDIKFLLDLAQQPYERDVNRGISNTLKGLKTIVEEGVDNYFLLNSISGHSMLVNLDLHTVGESYLVLQRTKITPRVDAYQSMLTDLRWLSSYTDLLSNYMKTHVD